MLAWKKISIFITFAICTFLVIKKLEWSDTTEINAHKKIINGVKTSEDHSSIESKSLSSENTQLNVDAEEDVTLKNKTPSQNNNERAFSKYQDPISTDEVNTEEKINSYFFSKNESIYERSITSTFSGNFSSFIDALSNLDRGSESLENEIKLMVKISRELRGHTFNEKLSCAGRVCAVLLSHSDKLDSKEIDRIHNFGSFYSFYNKSTDESGNNQTKIILLSTPDPSQLTLEK